MHLVLTELEKPKSIKLISVQAAEAKIKTKALFGLLCQELSDGG